MRNLVSLPFLAHLLSFLSSLAASTPLPLLSRQITALSFDWDKDDKTVYRSSGKLAGKSVNCTVRGITPPFSIDAVAANDSSVVLEHVVNMTAGSTASWSVDLADGQHFAFRVTDSSGQSVLSEERKVKSGGKHECGEGLDTSDLFFLIFPPIQFALFLAVVGYTFYVYIWRGYRHSARTPPAARDDFGVELPAQPAPAYQPSERSPPPSMQQLDHAGASVGRI
ncbi:hypothetical protein JCM10207_002508 [Rhodosporidiobolus poonsookiae]